MRQLFTLLFLILLHLSVYAQCEISSISYEMPDCNLEGQTITINWTATCPDELLRVLLADRDNLITVQSYINVANTGSFDFVVNNNDLIDANYNFYIDFYPSQEDWIHGPTTYQVNDPQISVLEEFYALTDGDVWTDNTGWLSDCDPCGMISGTPWYGLTCDGLGKILKIDLSNNGLIGEYANDTNSSSSNHFCDLPDLQYIDLSQNQLTGTLPSCYFSTAKDTLRLNNNMLTGGIPFDIQSSDPDMLLDISNNQLTGCFENYLNPRCGNSNFTNATISEGNSFEGNWEDFCAAGDGVCCESAITIDLATIENGSYYARDQITLLGTSTASTDIVLNSDIVLVDMASALNSLGSNIELTGDRCFKRQALDFTSGPGNLYNPDFAFPDEFTMTFWFNTSDVPSSYESRIFNLADAANRFEIGIDGSSRFWVYDNTSTYSSTLTYTDGIWHHVIVRSEGDDIDFYVDGELVFTSDQGANPLTNGFRIGRYAFSGIAYYDGKVSDFRIYNQDLDLESAIEEYECNSFQNDDKLVLHYPFNEGIPYADNTAVSIVEDNSGNGNDADIISMTLNGSESNYVDADDIAALECCNQGFAIICFTVAVQLNPVTGQAEVEASFFDEDTELNCGDAYTVSYTPDGLTTTMTFDCQDVGLSSITIYFISEDGLIVDSCDAFIEVQDNDGICD